MLLVCFGKGLSGGSLKIASETKIISTKKSPQKILRLGAPPWGLFWAQNFRVFDLFSPG